MNVETSNVSLFLDSDWITKEWIDRSKAKCSSPFYGGVHKNQSEKKYKGQLSVLRYMRLPIFKLSISIQSILVLVSCNLRTQYSIFPPISIHVPALLVEKYNHPTDLFTTLKSPYQHLWPAVRALRSFLPVQGIAQVNKHGATADAVLTDWKMTHKVRFYC